MFTGLIEAVGEVVELKATSDGYRLRVATNLPDPVGVGESVAVNGVCLTAVAAQNGEISADIGPETARVTNLGDLKRGVPVNIERPMRTDGRFGGHLVMGHIDTRGRVEEIRHQTDFEWVTIGFPSLLEPYLILKGSIAVDGISLTVAGLGRTSFDVMIIPFTWEHTNFKVLRVGDHVNLECDMVGKYVVRAVELLGLGRGEQTH
jgi:riboflavin synthase